MSGMTDKLIEVGEKASRGSKDYTELLQLSLLRHLSLLHRLLPSFGKKGEEKVRGLFKEIGSVVKG
eukprot:CAMPEP_0174271710 /NCGR_PEP_ID=MMETSP0439-20130205/48759_1 /TAXON_ID=0 /ORGANISM="Stereomyxa ramosa, Strain Chinc5" /LENGTH=65 /DNA_ID=CAMNT_0015361867 /DNA_START=75 /DNA_END=268 /DNA_ORIENTATION=+